MGTGSGSGKTNKRGWSGPTHRRPRFHASSSPTPIGDPGGLSGVMVGGCGVTRGRFFAALRMTFFTGVAVPDRSRGRRGRETGRRWWWCSRARPHWAPTRGARTGCRARPAPHRGYRIGVGEDGEGVREGGWWWPLPQSSAGGDLRKTPSPLMGEGWGEGAVSPSNVIRIDSSTESISSSTSLFQYRITLNPRELSHAVLDASDGRCSW